MGTYYYPPYGKERKRSPGCGIQLSEWHGHWARLLADDSRNPRFRKFTLPAPARVQRLKIEAVAEAMDLPFGRLCGVPNAICEYASTDVRSCITTALVRSGNGYVMQLYNHRPPREIVGTLRVSRIALRHPLGNRITSALLEVNGMPMSIGQVVDEGVILAGGVWPATALFGFFASTVVRLTLASDDIPATMSLELEQMIDTLGWDEDVEFDVVVGVQPRCYNYVDITNDENVVYNNRMVLKYGMPMLGYT